MWNALIKFVNTLATTAESITKAANAIDRYYTGIWQIQLQMHQRLGSGCGGCDSGCKEG